MIKSKKVFIGIRIGVLVGVTGFVFTFLMGLGLVATTPAAFADHSEVTIVPAPGSGAPGCEEKAEGCYIPKEATVDIGGKVMFSNTDTAAHTFTAGTASEGSSGAFDSGLVIAGSSYEWTATTAGEFPYYCMVHPWMAGIVIVDGSNYSQDSAKITSNEIGSSQLDQSVYHVRQNENTWVKISGTISNPLKGSKVGITITNPEYDSHQSNVFTTDKGHYELYHPLDYGSPEGTYKVLVSYGGITGQMTFDVMRESQSALQSNESEISTTEGMISEKGIPEWFRVNAVLLSNEKISDSEFTDALAYLIHEGSVVIESDLSPKAEHSIPSWIKEIIRLQGRSTIDEVSFLQSIEFMARNGILGNGAHEKSPISDLVKINKKPSEGGVDITWTNNDSKSHTVTSGSTADGRLGRFDSTLLFPGQIFSIKIQDVGSLDYFCMVHPWEYGSVTITSEDLILYHETLEKQKLLAEEKKLQKEREIPEQINAIKSDWYFQTLQPFAKVPSPSEMLDMMGKEKSEKYKEFFEGLQSRNIQAENLELLLSSDKITLEERKIILNYLEDVLLVMKTLVKDRLSEYDGVVQEIINEINKKDLPDADKSQLITEIRFDSDTRKNQIVSVFANVMEPLESTLEKEKSKQGIIDKLTNESPIRVGGGGCLIATATFGSELAPQVQQLRELRDNSLLQTASGTSFMTGFNQFYYSFSPFIADYERENPVFKEVIKITLTPMISSLSLLNYVDMNSEGSVLGYGVSLILLNVGMYLVAPAMAIMKIRKAIQNNSHVFNKIR